MRIPKLLRFRCRINRGGASGFEAQGTSEKAVPNGNAGLRRSMSLAFDVVRLGAIMIA